MKVNTGMFIVTCWAIAGEEPLYFIFNSLKAAIDRKISMEILGYDCDLYAKIDYNE